MIMCWRIGGVGECRKNGSGECGGVGSSICVGLDGEKERKIKRE